jgi:hypothetical protein
MKNCKETLVKYLFSPPFTLLNLKNLMHFFPKNEIFNHKLKHLRDCLFGDLFAPAAVTAALIPCLLRRAFSLPGTFDLIAGPLLFCCHITLLFFMLPY